MSNTFNHEADAWDSLDWEFDDDVGDGSSGPLWPRCPICGVSPLQWKATPFGWRLYDQGKPHVCGLTAARLAAFATLESES